MKIEQYIEANLGERLSVPELCDRFSVSKFALYRLFREEFQTTVTEFILEKRIDLACQLLGEPQFQSITQVSEACGFADYNYFIRVFKARKGVTPLKYRQKLPGMKFTKKDPADAGRSLD